MVQAADLWEGDNVAGRGRLHGAGLGAILAEREMRVFRRRRLTPIGVQLTPSGLR